MGKVVLTVIKWHPFLVLVAYTFLVADYRRNFDGNLRYIAPQFPAAPEDILGFGFWATWLVVAAWFVLACFLSYRFGMERKAWYWVPLLALFFLLSVVDFYLYGALARQVLALNAAGIFGKL